MLKVRQRKNLLILFWHLTSTPRGLPTFLLGLSDGLDSEKCGGEYALGVRCTLRLPDIFLKAKRHLGRHLLTIMHCLRVAKKVGRAGQGARDLVRPEHLCHAAILSTCSL